MKTQSSITLFFRSTEASISVLTAVLAGVIIGFAGIAVDLSSLVYWKGRLRGATDAAALAATFDPSRAGTIAAQSLQANGFSDVAVEEIDVGHYTDDPALSTAARFQIGAPNNAVRVATSREVPIYFMRLFTGVSTMTVASSATAYNLPLGGVAIGTGVLDSDIVQLNAFMTAQSGSALNLTAAERDALEATPIAVFRLFDQLAGKLGSQQDSIADVMASSVRLGQLADSMAQALSDQTTLPTGQEQTALAALTRIAQQGQNAPPALVSDILALGAHQKRAAQDLISSTTDSLTVPAMTLLMGDLQASRQGALVNVSQTIPLGVIKVSVDAVMDRPGGGQPAVTVVGPEGTSAYSSAARIKLTVSLTTPITLTIPLVGTLSLATVPVIVDVGTGSATISDVSCGADIMGTTDIAIAAQSGLIRVYVGNATTNQLVDFLTPIAPVPAQIANLGVLSVSASGQINAGQSAVQTLHFDRSDIEQGTVRSVDASSSIGTTLATLNSTVNVTVSNTLLSALVAPIAKTAVSTILTALQPVIPSILASLGLRVGYMDVQATSVRCGIPALVT